ncbi:MAG: WYL domain-containing protein [Spirochaetaceae bacterium]|jgi:predicted DNA-binding transcriptional regulator YafY|nr:WYL domain-containing protein [Spirochaetaceae bacterium]
MDTRKNLPRTALARIYFIDQQIASGKYPNVNYLAKEYEAGTATIYRDIEYMRDMLGAPIEYCAKNRGWFYAEKSFRLPARFAAANDMLALGMAKNLLSLYRDTPLYNSAKRLLDDITAPLTKDNFEKDDSVPWYENRIVVPPVASAPVNPGTWERVISAMRENRLLAFEYYGIWDDRYKSRLVRPYQLLFDNGVWFLYGYAEERAGIRIFNLSRMKNVSLTNETFTLPEDYDYIARTDGSYFGVFAGKKYRFKIALNKAGAQWAGERKWAADQTIKEKDTGFIVEFTSTQYNRVLEWVLSRGADAYPLEPAALASEWKKHVRGMMKKFEGS